MASAPQQPQLPLFFNDLMPLNSRDHKNFRSRSIESAPWLAKAHAIPLTVDEFVQAQRDFPIVFSSGENPLPLALMGLNEGVNTFVGEDGKVTEQVYLPAYIRRYPFMLAKMRPDATDLSLMFDPTSEAIGEFDEGERMFDDEGNTTDTTKRVLEFCQHFEQSAQRTQAFLTELKDADLLMDGEVAIQREGEEKPFVYRGFKMVDQKKLQELPADKVEAWNKSGLMMLVNAHIFSLELMRVIFARQVQQGTAPKANAAA
ncbi:SapC family protein [Qipengyuania aurantiaca]|uniref:SapC family protein n=1 Tax=Qipengyuania aurantiaca TaxID=2867233 RepID=A0ABX8ZKH5_9SPHN|nr:SapC family protein [Qipengyuania aurantiaca]QZD89466.1 SapC family protein [Qipengyuania aurantiaca]